MDALAFPLLPLAVMRMGRKGKRSRKDRECCEFVCVLRRKGMGTSACRGQDGWRGRWRRCCSGYPALPACAQGVGEGADGS